MKRQKATATVLWGIRLSVAAVLLWAAVSKLSASSDVSTIYSRWTLKWPVLQYLVPGVELLLGILLITGVRLRQAAIAGIILLSGFTTVLVFETRQPHPSPCGCSAQAPAMDPDQVLRHLWLAIARNVLLMGGLVIVFVRESQRIPRNDTAAGAALVLSGQKASSILMLSFLVLASSSLSMADAPNRPQPAAEEAEKIVQGLTSKETQRVAESVARVRELMKKDPANFAGLFQRTIAKPMLDAGLNDEVADLALEGISAVSASTSTVEALLTFRIKSELAAGKGAAALADSKSLFNVSSMAGTGSAILLVDEALRLASPKEEKAGAKFRAEQLAGASTQPSTPKSATLLAIKPEVKSFEKLIPQSTPDEYNALVSRGNLLLMANRIDEAREAFEAAYSLADNRMLPAATENLARCMKAEDGTVGRANAWVLSLRNPPAK